MGAEDRGWGWPSATKNEISEFTVKGVPFPGGIHRDVEPVMRSLVQEFHNRVERLHDGWCWGYAYRYISGTRIWSNHAWGLAVDLNAPLHPYGSRDTFGWRDRERCRAIAEKHMCRWGGDYSGTPDDMHFEFMGSPYDARRLANNTETDGDSAMAWITLTRDQHGDKWTHATEVVQAILNTDERSADRNIEIDGYYGDVTERRVRDFQRWANITVDGMTGPETYRHLLYANIRGDQVPGRG